MTSSSKVLSASLKSPPPLRKSRSILRPAPSFSEMMRGCVGIPPLAGLLEPLGPFPREGLLTISPMERFPIFAMILGILMFFWW